MMKRTAFFLCPLLGQALALEPKFEAQVIDDKIGIGYGLAIGDVDGDKKPDILLADAREIVWYRNPTWEKRKLAGSLTKRDHVCIAARDVDGDGKVEVAVGAQWNPGETANEAESGAVFYLQRPAEGGDGPWTAVPLPHEPTVHRMGWVKNGDGKFHLLVVPLHGRGNKNGAGENGVRIHAFPFPAKTSDPAAWQPQVISDRQHITHNFDPSGGPGGDRIIVGSREGFLEASPVGAGWEAVLQSPADVSGTTVPFAGIGEIRFGPQVSGAAPGGVIAAVEPFHGSHLAVYEKNPATREWIRQVLDSAMNQGHALACGNLLGLPREQIIAGWREPNAAGAFGIRIHWQEKPEQPWQKAWVATGNSMACEDLKLADLDGDGRLEIIASGRSTKNVVIYWNRTAVP